MIELTKEVGLNLFSFHQLIEEGYKIENTEKYESPSLESIAITCFTSGSTGWPKGVMLSHLTFLSNHASL